MTLTLIGLVVHRLAVDANPTSLGPPNAGVVALGIAIVSGATALGVAYLNSRRGVERVEGKVTETVKPVADRANQAHDTATGAAAVAADASQRITQLARDEGDYDRLHDIVNELTRRVVSITADADGMKEQMVGKIAEMTDALATCERSHRDAIRALEERDAANDELRREVERNSAILAERFPHLIQKPST